MPSVWFARTALQLDVREHTTYSPAPPMARGYRRVLSPHVRAVGRPPAPQERLQLFIDRIKDMQDDEEVRACCAISVSVNSGCFCCLRLRLRLRLCLRLCLMASWLCPPLRLRLRLMASWLCVSCVLSDCCGDSRVCGAGNKQTALRSVWHRLALMPASTPSTLRGYAGAHYT